MFLGPRTGQGAGYCSGFGGPGFLNPMRGLFFGRGRGFRGHTGPWVGRGEGLASETDLLREQADILREQLKAVEARIGQTEGDDE